MLNKPLEKMAPVCYIYDVVFRNLLHLAFFLTVNPRINGCVKSTSQLNCWRPYNLFNVVFFVTKILCAALFLGARPPSAFFEVARAFHSMVRFNDLRNHITHNFSGMLNSYRSSKEVVRMFAEDVFNNFK